MLQKEINRSYSTFPNAIAFAKLRTCACFSVTSVPKFANTAVWGNSIVALRVHVTGGRWRDAFINICSKREKCFSLNKYEKIECLRDIMKSLSQVRRKFWHQKWQTERWREELTINWFSSNAQFEIYASFLWLKPSGVWEKNVFTIHASENK